MTIEFRFFEVTQPASNGILIAFCGPLPYCWNQREFGWLRQLTKKFLQSFLFFYAHLFLRIHHSNWNIFSVPEILIMKFACLCCKTCILSWISHWTAYRNYAPTVPGYSHKTLLFNKYVMEARHDDMNFFRPLL